MGTDEKKYYVHETSIVEPNVNIGEGTKIWLFSHIMSGASIGIKCNIGQNVYIGKGVKIGDYVKIQNNVSVYESVELEDYVFCGPSCVFTNVINPRSEIERKNEFKPTIVKYGASIGANATILCGIEIGKFAFIGAGAVVLKPVSDYALIVGNPGRQAGWMCRCGVRLKMNKDYGICLSCGEKYFIKENKLYPGEKK